MKYLLLVLVLSGCGYVTSEEWAEGQALCKEKGGMDRMLIDGECVTAKCSDEFEYSFCM